MVNVPARGGKQQGAPFPGLPPWLEYWVLSHLALGR